jgi:DNA-binding transcriptional MocR family regulator
MHRYQDIVALYEAQIRDGIFRVGDRLPSVRETSRSLGASVSTVYSAFSALESKGFIRAKPKSGYVVIQQEIASAERQGRRGTSSEERAPVDLEAIALQILGADIQEAAAATFGSAYFDSAFFPIDRLLCLMRDVSRRPPLRMRSRPPAGVIDLRREIAKRYTRHGYSISLDEIITTTGSIDGLNLALSALTRPGDAVAVEEPCFFPVLFSLRRHGLRPVPVPMSLQHGLELDALKRVLAGGEVKACIMMPSCHTPLGVSLSPERQTELVRLVERYNIPLIENDAYGELRPPEEGSSTCKIFDRSGLVLHCSSFSNSLSPQLRVGWISAGRFRDRILAVKFLTNMTSNWIAQQTAAEFLAHENVDRHLRAIRSALDQRLHLGLRELDRWKSIVLERSTPKHGFTAWLRLPERVNTLELFSLAAAEGLSFVPGALFSVEYERRCELALNFSCEWTPNAVRALDRLMSLASEASRGSGVSNVREAAPHLYAVEKS